MNTINTISIIVAIIGAITGIIGMVISILGRNQEKYHIVYEFLNGMTNPEFIKAREMVYNQKNNDVSVNDENMAFVVNYFHQWGLLAKKGYLPLWVFNYGSGAGAIRLYEAAAIFIKKRRQLHEDDTYAYGFEWLYYRLKRKKIEHAYSK